MLAVIVILTILRQYLDSAEQEPLWRRCYEEFRYHIGIPTSLHRYRAGSEMKNILAETLYRDGKSHVSVAYLPIAHHNIAGIHFYCIVLSASE